jgi:hypothetical protein
MKTQLSADEIFSSLLSYVVDIEVKEDEKNLIFKRYLMASKTFSVEL